MIIVEATAAPPTAPHPPVMINVTNNNNNSNNLFVISMEAPIIPPHQFPYQDLSHLTNDFKQKVIETCTCMGFAEGIRRMFGALYFDPSQPHNMNVIILEGGDTKVFREKTWRPHDTDEAIKEMFEEHGQAIYNFPGEMEEEVGIKVTESNVDAIDRAYEGDEHLGDPVLAAALKRVAEVSMTAFDRVLMGRYRHVFQGLMTGRQAL
jgi:hypothetical protein